MAGTGTAAGPACPLRPAGQAPRGTGSTDPRTPGVRGRPGAASCRSTRPYRPGFVPCRQVDPARARPATQTPAYPWPVALTDEAIERIKEMIVSGELGPGDRLPKEGDLAVRLGLSRNSLREA